MGKGSVLDGAVLRRTVRPVVRVCACSVLAASMPLVGYAANYEYQLTAGAGHSDNIRRTATNEVDENVARAGLQFSADQRTSRLDADVIGNVAYYDYLDNTYDAELLGNFIGNARVALVQDRVEWLFTDNFGQVLTDPFSPETAENRENINYFTTGPDVTFALGSQTRLRLGGRYALTTYERTPFDSDSVLGDVGLERLLSSASSIALHARMQQIDYDDAELNADYDQSEVSMSYQAEGARTFLALEAGYSQIERDSTDGTDGDLLLRLDVSRRLSASMTGSLTAAREFSSAGAAFASAQSSGGGIGLGAQPGRQTVDPFTNDYATLGWAFDRNRTSLSLSATHSAHTYEDNPVLDQTLVTFAGGARRELSTATSLLLDVLYMSGTFEEPGRDYKELGAGVTFTWRLSRRLSLSFAYDFWDRDSDVLGGDYSENRYWVQIGFQRGEPRDQPLQRPFAVDAALPAGT